MKTTQILGLATSISCTLVFCSCGDDSSSDGGKPGTGGTQASGGTGTGGETATGGTQASGGSGASTGGEPAGGAGGTVASGGSGGGGPQGTPYVFVGSTDGFVRVYTMNESDGSLTDAGSLDTGTGLDFIAVGPDDRTVFVSYDGSVASFTYDPTAKTLTPLDSATTFGVGTSVAVDPTGGFVFVAHYNEGKLSFLPYSGNSGFAEAQQFSPGQNAHQVRIDASGKHVYVPCLGSDYIAQFVLDPTGGTLIAATPPTAAAGNGPRHMDFHPTAPVAYVVSELDSAIRVFDIDDNGLLTRRANGDVFMSADEKGHKSSDVRMRPDGKFLYAVNREPSEIVTFRVEADQSVTRLDADPLTGVVRSFGMDPAGKFIQIGGNDGRLAALKIDATSGALTETSAKTGLGDIHATVVRYLEP